jgi:hypothetical protein
MTTLIILCVVTAQLPSTANFRKPSDKVRDRIADRAELARAA